VPTGPATFLHALKGKFLAFEGPDGSGKSTQLRHLVALCQQHAIGVCEVREPGGSTVGEQVRTILLNKDNTAQLVEERIRPAMAAGHIVIADRFVTSTYAYQGAAGGLPAPEIDAVAGVACGGTLPDLVLLYDVDEHTAAKRAGLVAQGRGKRADSTSGSLFADRIEERGRDFQKHVRAGYLAIAKREPERHAVIDASRGPDEVWDATRQALETWAARRS